MSGSKVPYWVVDAFAEREFQGNPAAVCLLDEPAGERWMQLVARELNLSETAFVSRRAEGGHDLRWFTPTVEVDLCGHATLAGAHVLWEHAGADPGAALAFHTRSGELRARREGAWIALDFPSEPATPAEPTPELVAGLRAMPQWTGRSRYDWLCLLADESAVRALAPDMALLARLGTRGVIATARADARHDFVSRFFAPGAGIPEDPVTGSAHCTLGPFWAERLGRTELTGWQASARGGLVKVVVRGARTHLLGQAVTIAEGKLIRR